MATFDSALARVQRDCAQLLPARIDALARAAEHTFRNTTLTPGNTLTLFVRQIACGNVACAAMRHLAGEDFSDSAWCAARARLPLKVIEQTQRELVDDARSQLNLDQSQRWYGHRVYVIDGSSDSMPDTPPLRAHYGVPSVCRDGLGFPTSHLLLLMDRASGLFIDCIDNPLSTSDPSQAPKSHARLGAGDVLLGDVAFSGWAHLALIIQRKLHAVVPMHQCRIVDFTPDRSHAYPKSVGQNGRPRSRVLEVLGTDDQLVECFKPVNKPAWMDRRQWRDLPPSIRLREIRRTVRRNGFRPITMTIVTTLLDPQLYPADDLVELRLTRWLIETNIRHLKITLKMDELKCKTVDGVRKERLIFLLVYNLIRLVMLKAAKRQKVNVNRLSFGDTLAWLRWGEFDAQVQLIVNPLRAGRLEPRVRKKPKKQFPYMTLPRSKLKSQLRARYQDMS